METALFSCWMLVLLFSPAAPMCLPIDFTLYVEKPECDFCVQVNTTSCMGFCRSWESNLVQFVSHQRGCTYDKVEYRTVVLPGCPANTNPLFTYPVALSCHCGACQTESGECTHKAGTYGPPCTKPVTHAFPYLGQGNYVTPL